MIARMGAIFQVALSVGPAKSQLSRLRDMRVTNSSPTCPSSGVSGKEVAETSSRPEQSILI